MENFRQTWWKLTYFIIIYQKSLLTIEKTLTEISSEIKFAIFGKQIADNWVQSDIAILFLQLYEISVWMGGDTSKFKFFDTNKCEGNKKLHENCSLLMGVSKLIGSTANLSPVRAKKNYKYLIEMIHLYFK